MPSVRWFPLVLCLNALALAAVPQWNVTTVQGVRLQVPAGWQVKPLGPGQVVLKEPFQTQQTDTVMYFQWSAKPATGSAQGLAQVRLQGWKLGGGMNLIGESLQQGVLHQLYLGSTQAGLRYLSVVSDQGRSTPQRGAWVTAFMASGPRFNELGGSLFPFAVLGKVTDGQLAQATAKAQQQAVTYEPPAPNPNCQVTANPQDTLDRAFNAIAASSCAPDPTLSRIGAILQNNMDQAFDRYEASMKRFNAAWDRYEQRMMELCSGQNARTPAELARIQQMCGLAIASTTNSINSWHQTNQGVLYNMSGTPWCYADKYGNCR